MSDANPNKALREQGKRVQDEEDRKPQTEGPGPSTVWGEETGRQNEKPDQGTSVNSHGVKGHGRRAETIKRRYPRERMPRRTLEGQPGDPGRTGSGEQPRGKRPRPQRSGS